MKLRYAFAALFTVSSLLAGCGGSGSNATTTTTPVSPPAATRTIIMVWDGLRPDDVNATDTPNLYAMRQAGVNFSDNHSTYPTFTMMNAASFATGGFPKNTGFYGNTFWTPPRAPRTPSLPAIPRRTRRRTTSIRSSQKTTKS